MNMFDGINALIGEFSASIVKFAMMRLTATAMLRELSDAECDEIVTDIASATERFLNRYEEVMSSEGIKVSPEELEGLREQMHSDILESTWLLVNRADAELAELIRSEDNGSDYN